MAYDDFREKTCLDHGSKTIFLPKRLHSTKSYFIKAIDHTFYEFTGVITHLGCWENTRRVGYHAGKLIESVVIA